MDIVVDLINRVEEQEALVVQNVRRPRTRLETLVDDATLRTRTRALQLQVQHRARAILPQCCPSGVPTSRLQQIRGVDLVPGQLGSIAAGIISATA